MFVNICVCEIGEREALFVNMGVREHVHELFVYETLFQRCAVPIPGVCETKEPAYNGGFCTFTSGFSVLAPLQRVPGWSSRAGSHNIGPK